MNRKPDLIQCSNCLTIFKKELEICPNCAAVKITGDNAKIVFSDMARQRIAYHGGIYGGIIKLSKVGDVIVWCETGVFRFKPKNRIMWDRADTGIIDDVKIINQRLYVNDEEWDLNTGKTL